MHLQSIISILVKKSLSYRNQKDSNALLDCYIILVQFYTVLFQLKNIMGILGQKHSIITFDLAIYKFAKEMVWSRPQEFQHTIIRLGGFHVILNYLGALGNMHTSSGVIGLMSESGVFSNTTIRHILSRGNYKRGVRFYKLLPVYKALLRKKPEAPK